MAISAEQLNIILSARDKEFTKAMERSQRRVEMFAKKSQKSMSTTGRLLQTWGMLQISSVWHYPLVQLQLDL
jgi:hypothetical protein